MRTGDGKRLKQGFTIIELMVVMAILGLLVSLVAPRYFRHVDKARESVLKQNLYVTRDAIDKYHSDNGRYPESLQVLVEARYIRQLPEDPITGRADTWVIVPPKEGGKRAVFDIRSSAAGKGLDGKDYASW